jgi:hypothetical protein
VFHPFGMDKLDVVLTVFFEVFEFEGPAPLKAFEEIVFFEEFELKVFEFKGSLKVLEKVFFEEFELKVFEFKGSLKVLEKVFGLKVFKLEGAPPFEVFELEVLKVFEFEGALPFKRT